MLPSSNHYDDSPEMSSLPYHSSVQLVGYSLRDEKDMDKDALDDDHSDDDAFRASYPPPAPRYSVAPQEDSPHPQTLSLYPPRKLSKASSVDVSDIIESYEDSVAHEDVYKPPKPPANAPRTSFLASFIPSSWTCRLYLLVALFETFIDVAIEVELFFRLNNVVDSQSAQSSASGNDDQANLQIKRLPIYIFLFGLAHGYQFILAVDAVRSRNMLQILFLAVFNALFIGYSVIQINEIQSAVPAGTPGIVSIPINVVTSLIPVVISVAEVVYLILSWQIQKEFGWQVYKLLGADRNVKRMYWHYQIFECLLKFDIYFWIGFSVQFIFFTLPTSSIEYPITIAALPISLLLLLEGHLAARYENRWLMSSFMIGSLAGCVYFTYKLVRILSERDDTDASKDLSSVWKSLTLFSGFSIFLLLLTFGWASIVLYNFGRGLKRHLGKSKRTLDPVRARTDGAPGFRNPNRMSIE